jgi:CDP-diacylglycerol--glycerol-3-phosphate 3-phosphatidyltransferase
LFRIISAPLFVFLWFFLTGERRLAGLWVCLIVACLSEISDLLDGQIARATKQVSTFGKLMDPYADAIFRSTVFLCFASTVDGNPWYPLWMPILLVIRDMCTSAVRTFAMEQGIVVAAKASGKTKAIAQGIVMIALLVLAIAWGPDGVNPDRFPEFCRDAWYMMLVVVLAAYWALAEHLWTHIAVFWKSAKTD